MRLRILFTGVPVESAEVESIAGAVRRTTPSRRRTTQNHRQPVDPRPRNLAIAAQNAIHPIRSVAVANRPLHRGRVRRTLPTNLIRGWQQTATRWQIK